MSDFSILALIALAVGLAYWHGHRTAAAKSADHIADLELALDAFAPRQLVHPSRGLSVIRGEG